MVIAQLPPASANEFAAVIVALAGVLVIALLIKNLFFSKLLAEQSINRSEFDKIKDKVERLEKDTIDKTQYNELKGLCATKDSVESLKGETAELRKYMHERHHKLANDMNLIQLSLEKMHLEIHKENEANNKAVVDKIDNMVRMLYNGTVRVTTNVTEQTKQPNGG